MILTSAALAALGKVIHGFSTRLGGVSSGPYATLNLGRAIGDSDDNIDTNLRRLRFEAGLPKPVAQVSQVHGARIVEVDPTTDLRALRGEEADGLWTRTPGIPLGVRTADCAPVLIVAPDGQRSTAVAAVHAGWRGATAGIVPKAIQALRDAGFEPEEISVAIGPMIELPRFEVGEEVIEAARTSLGGRTPPMQIGPNGRPHLDLRTLLAEQLIQCGVRRERIDQVGGCTFDQPALFYSHRRDHGKTGRHLSVICGSS